MKKIWNYDPVNKEISGAGYADPDPLENPDEDIDGAWTLPAFATFVEPPDPVDGNVRVFNETEQKWGYVRVESEVGTVPTDTPHDEPEPEKPLREEVDFARDNRIDNGFEFMGAIFQSHRDARENLNGIGTAALAAITLAGAQEGDLRWENPDEDFCFIDVNDVRHPMDAITAFALARAAFAHKAKLIFAANDLKKLFDTPEGIPADFATNPAYWP